MIKKIVLIYPKFLIQDGGGFNIPLSLLHLGTFLQSKGYLIKIIDGNVEKNYEKLIFSEAKNAFAVCVSTMTDQLPEARRLAILVKKKYKIPVVFGGVHPTLFPKQVVLEPYIDFAVVGEGEISFWHLLQYLGKKRKITNLKGVAFLDKSRQFFLLKQSKSFDFSKMPLINYSLLSQKITAQFSTRSVGVLTSRGCPHQCSFCINTVIKENRLWRAWPAKRVIKEIKNLQKKYHADKLFFWDENFFVSKKRVEQILTLLEKEKIKIKWFANIRADFFNPNYLNLNFLKRLRKNGCLKLGIGAESGSQRMLDIYHKQITPGQILLSAKYCQKAGIAPTYSFMIGAPKETKIDIKKTLILIRKIFAVCPRAKILGPQLFRPYPGSLLYQQCLKSGWQEPKNLPTWSKIISRDFMESNAFKSPWIKQPGFVNIVWFYSLLLVLKPKKLIELLSEYCVIYQKTRLFYFLILPFIIFGSLVGKFRLYFNLYSFPFEVKLFRKFRSVLSS